MATISVRNLTRATLQLALPHDVVCAAAGRCLCLAAGTPSTLIIVGLKTAKDVEAAVLTAPAVQRAIARRLVQVIAPASAPSPAAPSQPEVEPQQEPHAAEHSRKWPGKKRKHRPGEQG